MKDTSLKIFHNLINMLMITAKPPGIIYFNEKTIIPSVTPIPDGAKKAINPTTLARAYVPKIKGKYVKEIVVMLFAKRYTPIPIKNHFTIFKNIIFR